MKQITTTELCQMTEREGLLLQGCGGDLNEWVDGINEMLTTEGILKNGSTFTEVSTFEHGGCTNLLYHFEGVELNMGKLAMWRLETHGQFAGSWLSDYLVNKFGIDREQQTAPQEEPDCPLIGTDGYGYTVAVDGELAINKVEAKVVRFIFERYLRGDSFGKIATALEKQNILSPTGKAKWNREAISKLLSNEKYTGSVLLQKTMSFAGTQFQNDGELDQVLIKNHHELIITVADFEKVQQMKNERSKKQAQECSMNMSI